MYEKVEIAGAVFDRATHYQMDGGRFARVVLIPQEASPDRFVVSAQAFEVDAAGGLVAGPYGMSSRTPGTQHIIVRSSLGDTHTVQPGYVRVVGDYDALNVGDEFEKVEVNLTQKNETGKFYNTVTEIAYRWDNGELETIRQGKVKELSTLLVQELDAAQSLGL